MSFLCIDLKSFFASCECVHNNLDPFKTPLIVTSKTQGQGAMSLAVTPYLKNKGVPSRSRLYEIPKHIKYTLVEPKMWLYKEYSEKVIEIYKTFISSEDLIIYSVDECFLNITNYLKLYKTTDEELAKRIIAEVFKKTGLTACCGIGPNMFIAKLALDNEAKKRKDNIKKWSHEDLKEKLITLYPLRKIWGIGLSTEKKLNNMGIFNGLELANYDKTKLVNILGKNIGELHDHLNGLDTQENLYGFSTLNKSFSSSKTFLSNQNFNSISPDFFRLVEDICHSLRSNNLLAKTFKVKVSYSTKKEEHKTFFFDKGENNSTIFLKLIEENRKKFNSNLIRKIEVSVSNLINYNYHQMSLFENHKNSTLTNEIADKINKQNKKTKVIKATSLIK